MHATNIGMSGFIKTTLYDEFGNVKQHQEFPNLIVASGKTVAAARLAGTSLGVMTHIGVGSSSTAPSDGQTDLISVVGSRQALDVSGGTPSGATVTYTRTFAAGENTGTLTEIGLFSASSGGNMLARSTFTAIPKGAGDTLAVTWTITFS